MNQPVLSIDVAKGKSVAAAFLSYGEVYRKPFSFSHTPDQLSSLLDLLEQLKRENPLHLQVVLEATGNYSKPIVSFFSSHGYPVVVLNPLHTHQMKKKSVRKIKTDPVDAMRIAQVFYLGQSTPQYTMDDQVYELRTLCRQYNHWKGLYGEVQLHFRSVLDLLFPGYDKVFHKICNPTSLRLLAAYST